MEFANEVQKPADAVLLNVRSPASLSQEILETGRVINTAIAFDDVEAVNTCLSFGGGGVNWDDIAKLSNTKIPTVYENVKDDEVMEDTGEEKVKATPAAIKKALRNYAGLQSSITFKTEASYQQHLALPPTLKEKAVACGALKVAEWLSGTGPVEAFKTLMRSKGTTSRTLQSFAEAVSRTVKREYRKRQLAGEAETEELTRLMAGLNTEYESATLLARMVVGNEVDQYSMVNTNLLSSAIVGGMAESVNYLLQNAGEDKKKKLLSTPCHWENANSKLPLAFAIDHNSPVCFSALLENGADPLQSNGAYNALQTAVLKENYGLARWVLNQVSNDVAKALIFQANHQGITALMMCVSMHKCNLTFLQYLMDIILAGAAGSERSKKMAEALTQCSLEGSTVFHKTYTSKLLEIWKLLNEWANEASLEEKQIYHHETYKGGATVFDKSSDMLVELQADEAFDYNRKEATARAKEEVKKQPIVIRRVVKKNDGAAAKKKKPAAPKKKKAASSSSSAGLQGETVVITGTFSVPRKELQTKLQSAGATVANSVTAKVTKRIPFFSLSLIDD